MQEKGLTKAQQTAKVDALAAAVILQDALEAFRRAG